jgi:hypothetical protein
MHDLGGAMCIHDITIAFSSESLVIAHMCWVGDWMSCSLGAEWSPALDPSLRV